MKKKLIILLLLVVSTTTAFGIQHDPNSVKSTTINTEK